MTYLDHTRIGEMLQDLVDGDLPEAERGELESHLEGCEKCREELDALTGAIDLLRALPQPQAPPDLSAKVRSRVRRRSGAGRRRREVESGIELTSAAAVLVATIMVLGTRLLVPFPEDAQAASASPLAQADSIDAPLIHLEFVEGEREALFELFSAAAGAGAVDESGRPLARPRPEQAIESGEHRLWVGAGEGDPAALRRLLAIIDGRHDVQLGGLSGGPDVGTAADAEKARRVREDGLLLRVLVERTGR